MLFITEHWNAKVGSQEIPGLTGKFGLRVQNEAEQVLTEYYQENALVMANSLFQQLQRQLYIWTLPGSQYQNLIMFFAAKDEQVLYHQQK